MSEETRGIPTCPECGRKMLDDRDGMYGGWFCAHNHPTVIQVVGSEETRDYMEALSRLDAAQEAIDEE